jgi:MtN3 and saliva related transmembrane protein
MHMTPQLIDMIGMAAGTLTTVSFLPQLIAVFRTKSAEDLSYGYLFTFSFGVILWLTYGVLLWAMPVILANAVTLVLLICIVGLKARYARSHRD